jgi:Sulfotransferase domain
MGALLNRYVKSSGAKDAVRAVVAAVRLLTGKAAAGRGVTVFPDDVYLTSYPRSGNTWTRFLLGNLLNPDDPVTFANVESRVPEIYFNPDRALRNLPRPRLLKSHEVFDPRYPRIIHIVRDPRDVAVSFYHHNIKAGIIPDNYPMDEFIPRFIAAEFDSARGSWADNVMSWLTMRQGKSNFLLLRYEDMKENTSRELLKVARFLQQAGFAKVETSPEKLARAVELSTPERMRTLEKQQAAQHVQLKRTRQDKPFIRSAKTGGWHADLSPKSVAQIETAWGDVMQNLGYALSPTTPEPELTRT